ncbi:hypothetical protein GCM10023116_46720 [Kistimonas scapharcae]|uniref:Uncharacterized protein n=1 Tax=Kistimonas scapharcae TaxID=1036133 RepID=A0ABP8VA12_9GAMM
MTDKVKVKIMRDTVANGEFQKKGKEVELSRRDAHTLTTIGRATYTDRMVEPESDQTMDSKNAATSRGKK